ncbi:MAG: MOSC domain-containing protein [Leptolyngbyaceae cyanobacterium SL_5_9]|nr:MOSC domain-containing protein [Leptolyngbyaceae cyanobacterium SM1_4_3]NJN59541.1 MOSC domain-containing protein [Leptolyngbyaceae cyanobacterium SL_5_9]NJO76358.1 MOSC domain-containing protein [Leptolyngbyaceae cyanobacterium RM1_406_9]
MNIISVNVGLPREVNWNGRAVSTGIFKEPIAGRIKVRSLNLEGDQQADLTVHGGVDKAVYAYSVESYDYWRDQLPEMDLPWGIFGENLTIAGLSEEMINVGDRFRVGTVELIATQPRMPCYKLGIRFGRPDIVKQFLDSRLTGVYFAVGQEGDIGAGDPVELVNRDTNHVTIADITSLYVRETSDLDLLHRAIQHPVLPEIWRDYFQQRLAKQS